ncbi:MAG: PAS domain S-box protein [Acidobacteria bacterium]|nr:PAS domain S-box protein [Acidobacteriota bacterium]
MPLDRGREQVGGVIDRQDVRMLLVIRIVAISSLLLAALIIQSTTDIILPINYLYFVTGLTYALTIVWVLLARVVRSRELHILLQMLGDLVLETMIVYFTGGLDSPFSFLYLISIVTAATMLFRRGALLVASASVIFYGGLVDLMYLGFLPLPSAGLFTPVQWSPARMYVNLATVFGGFYAAALLTSWLSEQLRRAAAELNARRADLARLRALNENVIASITSGLLTLDREGVITFVNYSACHIFGLDERYILGKSIVEIGFFNDLEWKIASHELRNTRLSKGETEIKHSDGSTRTVGYAATPLATLDGEPFGITIIFQDLTERKRLERQLQLRDRMAAVGELSAGIAHEIRNPLAAIAGSAQVLGKGSNLSESERRLLSIVLQESERLDRTIGDFLKFVRPMQPTFESFDIASGLEETLDLLKNSPELSESHRIELRIEGPLATVEADPNQIRQVFWNLARNAIQAMPSGGRLLVRGWREQTRYCVAFSDEGVGMSQEQRDRMFSPFHTSRASGTGLGMAISYRIVQEHGGSIVVEPAEASGTTVTIRLPCEQTSAQSADEVAPATATSDD